MKVILISFALAALSEMGDKTQWIACSLASRSRKPWMILSAVLTGIILNHVAAAWFGQWFSQYIPERFLVLFASLLFLFFGILGFWTILKDKSDEQKKDILPKSFASICFLFFIAEMGDKTQITTMTLSAQYNSPLLVMIGTTLGVVSADALAIFLGEILARKLPTRTAQWISASLFLCVGMVSLISEF